MGRPRINPPKNESKNWLPKPRRRDVLFVIEAAYASGWAPAQETQTECAASTHQKAVSLLSAVIVAYQTFLNPEWKDEEFRIAIYTRNEELTGNGVRRW